MGWNQSGIDYLCQKYGNSSLCVVSTGLVWDCVDATGVSHTGQSGGTADIAALILFNMLNSITMTTPSRPIITGPNYALQQANGGSLTAQDSQTVTQHDENSGDQWCYTAQNYTLTVSVTPSGGGSVTKNPDQATYPSGTVVALTAVPSANYAFDYWSGDLTGTTNPKSITMNGNKAVTAHFKSSSGVTCYGCQNGQSVSNTYPVGTVCSDTTTPGYPYSSYHDCGTNWMNYLLYAGIGLAVVGIIIYAVRKKPQAYQPSKRRK